MIMVISWEVRSITLLRREGSPTRVRKSVTITSLLDQGKDPEEQNLNWRP